MKRILTGLLEPHIILMKCFHYYLASKKYIYDRQKKCAFKNLREYIVVFSNAIEVYDNVFTRLSGIADHDMNGRKCIYIWADNLFKLEYVHNHSNGLENTRNFALLQLEISRKFRSIIEFSDHRPPMWGQSASTKQLISVDNADMQRLIKSVKNSAIRHLSRT